MKTNSRKSCAPDLFVSSDLTFDPSFNVKLVLVTLNSFPLLSFVLLSSKQKVS